MDFKRTVFLITVIGFLFASCESESESAPELPKGDYENGILIANEGAFSGGTGTVSYISEDYATEEAEIFNKVNNESIGTVLQSISFNGDDVYIIANVGNKISIADRYTMKKITEISIGLNNPRYIAFSNGKGFVTNWGEGSDTSDDFVAVIDLTTNTISSVIAVTEGPEQIIANGNTLYVSHKGGWGSGNSVTVINAVTNTIVQNILVGNIPDEMVIDNNENLLVSCDGQAATLWNPTEILGSLVHINTTTNEISSTLNFATGFHPNSMIFSDTSVYFSTSSSIYKMDASSTTMPTAEIITTPVYGFSVNDNKIYVTDAKDFQTNGSLKIFDALTNSEIKEFSVGLIPSKIYFN
jgi:hypothetical protein